VQAGYHHHCQAPSSLLLLLLLLELAAAWEGGLPQPFCFPSAAAAALLPPRTSASVGLPLVLGPAALGRLCRCGWVGQCCCWQPHLTLHLPLTRLRLPGLLSAPLAAHLWKVLQQASKGKANKASHMLALLSKGYNMSFPSKASKSNNGN
jgi:hypothetical protein